MPFDTCWRSEVITAYISVHPWLKGVLVTIFFHAPDESITHSVAQKQYQMSRSLGLRVWTAYKKREKTKMFTRNDCVDSQLWKYQVKLHHLWWYLGGSRGRMMPKRPESISDLPPTENILWISKCSMYDRGAQELLTHLQFSVSQESTESPLRTVLHDDDPPHW